MGSKSQETFFKKQREKDRARKKKLKQEKRESRKENSQKGDEIDWSIAPENKTLTQEERALKEANKSNYINK